jgi:hypothetical protein
MQISEDRIKDINKIRIIDWHSEVGDKDDPIIFAEDMIDENGNISEYPVQDLLLDAEVNILVGAKLENGKLIGPSKYQSSDNEYKTKSS